MIEYTWEQRNSDAGAVVEHPPARVNGGESVTVPQSTLPLPCASNETPHFCECGCGQVTRQAPQTIKKYGIKKGEWFRFCQGHRHRLTSRLNALDQNYITDGHGCWIWQGQINKCGYGTIGIGQRNGRKVRRLAHLVYYERKYGPVPKGKQLDHVKARGCHSRACVNPDHLEPVTPAINTQRSAKAKLTDGEVREIRRLHDEGALPYREIGTQFGISYQHVYGIGKRNFWRTVPEDDGSMPVPRKVRPVRAKRKRGK